MILAYYELKLNYDIILSGDLFLLVFSVDSRESFDEVSRLRAQIIETKCHIGGVQSGHQQTSRNGKKTNTPSPVPMVIAGNKCDREMRYSTLCDTLFSGWFF